MRSLLCEDFYSESFPYCDRKFVKRCDSGDKRDTWRAGDSEIKLVADPLIRNTSYSIGKAGCSFFLWLCCSRLRAQESFGQPLGDERARSDFRLKITFRMKSREGDVYSESRYSQVDCKLTRGGESGRVVVESCRNQFIANLPVKLFMERFMGSAVQPNHFKSHLRMTSSLLLILLFALNAVHDSVVLIRPTAGIRKLPSKWYGHFALSGLLTLYHMARSFFLHGN